MERTRPKDMLGIIQLHPQSIDAFNEAQAFNNDHIGTVHLIWGLLSTDQGGKVLTELGIDQNRLMNITASYLSMNNNEPNQVNGLSHSMQSVLEIADDERQLRKDTSITPSDLLIGILQTQEVMGPLLLKTIRDDEIPSPYDPLIEFRNQSIGKIRDYVRITDDY